MAREEFRALLANIPWSTPRGDAWASGAWRAVLRSFALSHTSLPARTVGQA